MPYVETKVDFTVRVKPGKIPPRAVVKATLTYPEECNAGKFYQWYITYVLSGTAVEFTRVELYMAITGFVGNIPGPVYVRNMEGETKTIGLKEEVLIDWFTGKSWLTPNTPHRYPFMVMFKQPGTYSGYVKVRAYYGELVGLGMRALSDRQLLKLLLAGMGATLLGLLT